MNTTEKDKFESLWANFIALVKGKLISTAAKQKLSYPLAKLILTEAALSWSSDYELNGKWLDNLKKTSPEKAALVSDVLLNDMSFTEMETTGELSPYYNLIIPAIGAGAGYAVSAYLGWSRIYQAVSTIAPAVMLYPAVNMWRKTKNETSKERTIEGYIQQLDKYKNSIVSILS